VSGFRVAVYGDGEYELGEPNQEYASGDDLPALPRLIHRLLGQPEDVSYTPLLFRKVRGGKGKEGKWEKKAKRAILDAERRRFQAVVIVVDRDRQPSRERLDPLKRARDQMSAEGPAPCAVGLAVETFDAWMIADGKAIEKAGGDPSRSHPDPEKLSGKEGSGDHPKERAYEILGPPNVLGGKYAVVAAAADLQFLEQRCSKGFKPFAADVRRCLKPVVPGGRRPSA